jgi:hypothetical protein
VIGRGRGFVRDAAWLTAERARAWGVLVALMIAIQAASLYWRLLASALADSQGRPEPIDFDAFWSGAHLAVHGHGALAYDLAAIRAEETLGAQPARGFLPYLYPPIFLMLCLPLGVLPYGAAMLAFMAAGYAAMVGLLRHILPRPWPVLSILAFPALMMNTSMGQSGSMAAACFALALIWLDRFPLLGGASLGLLAFKPHMALCVPVALLAARRWRALLACGATALGLAALSWLVLGNAVWAAFFRALPMIGRMLEVPDTWPKSLSIHTTVLMLGGGFPLAYAAQIATGLMVAGCVAWVGWRRPGAGPEISVLVCAAFLAAPHILDYDMVCLGVPMAWLAGQAMVKGWRAYEKIVLALAYIFPLEARNLNEQAGLPLTPFMVAMLFLVVLTRAAKD